MLDKQVNAGIAMSRKARLLVFLLALCLTFQNNSYANNASILPSPDITDAATNNFAQAWKCEQANVQLKVFYGQQSDPYSEALCELVLTTFREYPYLYEASEDYVNFLKSYGKRSDTIVAMAFDANRLVGVAIGIPLASSGTYQLPFLEKGYDPSALFYMGELVLDRQYRKKGLGKLLYSCLESAVKREGKYEAITLCQIEDPRYDVFKPTDYVVTDGFWNKLGFQHHPEINEMIYWINVGQLEKTPHLLVYWTKDITPPNGGNIPKSTMRSKKRLSTGSLST